jgi:DNA-binding response OmpR family regulator
MATSHDEPGEALRYEKAGADGYLCKPLDLDGLRAEIERVLRRT